MRKSRRDFLKIAGLSALGLGVKPAGDALAAGTQSSVAPDAKAIKGKRWAMVVDLKKFKESGEEAIKACVEACHTIHNVPHFDNPKDEVKWIWPTGFGHAFTSQEHKFLHDYEEEGLKTEVPVLCNHCDNPPCVRVCPTQATFKRPDGIVLMDMHRCIGCRFCMAACPFGARSLNWRDPRAGLDPTKINREFPTRTRGVVEKCNFCAERLAVGKMPACVEACKNKEMVFGDLEDPNSEVRELLKKNFAIRRKPQLGTQPQVYYIV
ncbi:sulfate reduction electron transfer complex DsrMKJOP subunit DsrO [Thermodesulfobacteriota bacterium]